MKFNSHTEMNGGKSFPNSLVTPKFGVKKGGDTLDNVSSEIGNIVQSVTENTKNIGSTIQGHFNRFLNNPMFSSDNQQKTNSQETILDNKEDFNSQMKSPLNNTNRMLPRTKSLSNMNSGLSESSPSAKSPPPSIFNTNKQITNSVVGGRKQRKNIKKTKKHLVINKKSNKHHKKTRKHKNKKHNKHK